MKVKQLITYLRKVAISKDEVDFVVTYIREYGTHSLALFHRSNGACKILGYGEPRVIDTLCYVLNRHLSDKMPGGFNACPYFYVHLTVGKFK